MNEKTDRPNIFEQLLALPEAPSIITQPAAPEQPLSPDRLTIFVSRWLDQSLERCRLVQRVGRFALVEYEPLDDPDPDIVMAYAVGIPAADAFNETMVALQVARASRTSESAWRAGVSQAIEQVEDSLDGMDPAAGEREFVLNWAELVLARGRRITGGPARSQNLDTREFRRAVQMARPASPELELWQPAPPTPDSAVLRSWLVAHIGNILLWMVLAFGLLGALLLASLVPYAIRGW